MEIRRHKPIFLLLLASILVGSATAAVTDLRIVSSSQSGFHFVKSLDSDLADLQRLTNADSTFTLFATVQVAIPAGSRVRLLSVEGKNPISIPAGMFDDADRLIEPSTLVDISNPFAVRGRTIVSLRIYPFSGMGLYSEVEVNLAFDRSRRSIALSAADDPRFDRVFGASLANYEQARNWPVLQRSGLMALGGADSQELISSADQWYHVTVAGTGLHQITGSQLQAAGIILSGLSIDSVRLFNAGGVPNDVDNYDDRPVLTEIAILISDVDSDGLFDSNDRLIFFGEAVDRWLYRAGYPRSYMNNRYATENVYWLAVSGDFASPPVRMGQIDGSPTGGYDTLVTTFWRDVHVEQENLISTESDGHVMDYYNWFWADSTNLTIYVPTPGAIGGDSAAVYLDGRTTGFSSVNGYIDMAVNGTAGLDKNCSRSNCRYTTYSLVGGAGELNRIDLQMELSSPSLGIPPFFNFLQISYHSGMQPAGDVLDIVLENSSARAEIQAIDEFSAGPTVFDLANPLRPVIISGVEQSGGLLTFQVDLTITGPNRFYCTPVSAASSPNSIKAVEIADLRTNLSQTDMIIVTAEAFRSYLDEYIDYRSGQGYSIQVVTVEDIMDNFSYGLYDPTAIRDFLAFAYETYPAPAPAIVLFVGDANYDFVDNYGTGVPNYVPPYVRPSDRSYNDDNYVYFGTYGLLDSDTTYPGDRGFDMITARWPIRSRAEIDAIVDKVKLYESTTALGAWRTNITLVADDEHGGDYDYEVIHVEQSDSLAKAHIPRFLTRNKIYLWDYPLANRERPQVNRAIVEAFNKGTLVVNYVGHGNPDVWAHEHVFERSSDLPMLANTDQLPLVFVASCAIGFFDDPNREGMAEDLLAMPGGAIGVISATRLVYSADNAAFNKVVFDNLLFQDSLTICEAMFAGKLQRQYPGPHPNDNDRAYIFLGDPCTRLAMPRLSAEFDLKPDSLTALDRARVAGRIVDAGGQTLRRDGVAQINVYDSDRDRKYNLINDDGVVIHTTTYAVTGPSIFRGSASISDGAFDFEFMTPLDIGYGGNNARVVVYAVFDSTDGVGLVDSLPVSTTLVSVADSTGPEIDYGIDGRDNFVSGDMVGQNESLSIRLTDESGINLAGGIGHGITLLVDEEMEDAVDLTSLFEYEMDDFASGSIIYPLESLAVGEHRLKIKAWDNANNLSSAELTLEISAAGKLALNDLLNYPNPMGESTTFYFELTQPVDRLSLKIFTVSGRNIWSYNSPALAADNYPNDNVRITWSGRDFEGDRVATGVYLYKATAVGQSEGARVEKFGKIIVVN